MRTQHTDHDASASPESGAAEPLRPDPNPTTTDEVAFSSRTPGPSRMRVGAVAGAAAALALGAVATSFAASPSPIPSSEANGPTVAAPLEGADPDEVDIELDRGRLGLRGFREITISAIDGSSVTLETDDGWSRTVEVTDSVALTKGGQEIEASDLAVGDQVRLGQTRNDDGSYTVDALAVVVPKVRGEVSDVSSSGFKVTTRDGSVWTVTVDGATEYRYGTGSGSIADITNGTRVLVQGTSTGDNALTATSVRVPGDRAVGTVLAKTADTITVKTRDGSEVTVHVDGDTTYRIADVETADLGDVAVDMAIGVSGRARQDGSIDADAVVAGESRFRLGDRGDGFFDGPGFGPVLRPDED
jgi:hypothetical protein